jgi:hypothetical protein
MRACSSAEHRELNFTPMGGAYNRVPADAKAFAHRAAPARTRGHPPRDDRVGLFRFPQSI